MDTITLSIDGQDVTVPKGATVLQAAEVAGVEIPVFCYHNRLSIAGNCRMCLVEIEGGPPKPTASCAMPAGDGMKVKTKTEMVKKARNGVLEFLLINHPLDCPICDQGGECDLQDITMAYGRDHTRYTNAKRAVKDKDMGPIVKTFMTRCIHCTRCVRFAEDVAGTPELGAIFRGEDMEITTYLDQTLSSELSGNVIDLCPVGALTSRPYSFKGRPWELSKTESIDVLDAVGSNIRVDVYGNTVMRILPRLNEAINEEWISDKTRYACDGLKYQRLDRPYIKKEDKLTPCSWEEAFAFIKENFSPLSGKHIAALAGDLANVESMIALKDLMKTLDSTQIDCRQDGAYLEPSPRGTYLFNTTIDGIMDADFCLMIGGHTRYDAPLINARLRKRYKAGGFSAYRIGGDYVDVQGPTFPITELGDDCGVLEEILKGTHAVSKKLKAAKKPMVVLSQQALSRSDGASIMKLVCEVCETYKVVTKDWNGFNVLHTAAARVGGLDIGFVPNDKTLDINKILKKAQGKDIKALYLLGVDEIDFSGLENTFIIYQGHHGDKGAHHADVILPGAAYTEQDGTFVNTEGRVQRAYKATNPPGDAKEDWKIIRALSEVLGKPLPYDTVHDVRRRIENEFPVFQQKNTLASAEWKASGKAGKLLKAKFPRWTGGFYQSDAISRHSKTLAACEENLKALAKKKGTGTHG